MNRSFGKIKKEEVRNNCNGVGSFVNRLVMEVYFYIQRKKTTGCGNIIDYIFLVKLNHAVKASLLSRFYEDESTPGTYLCNDVLLFSLMDAFHSILKSNDNLTQVSRYGSLSSQENFIFSIHNYCVFL